MRLVGRCGQLLGEAALEAERCQLRGKFDDNQGIGKTPDFIGAIELAGDKQEWQPGEQADQEAAKVDTAAARKRCKIGFSAVGLR